MKQEKMFRKFYTGSLVGLWALFIGWVLFPQSPPSSFNKEEVIALNELKEPPSFKDETQYAFMMMGYPRGLNSLKKNIKSVDVLIPQWIFLDQADGDLFFVDPEEQKVVLEVVRDQKPSLLILPMLVNYNILDDLFDGKNLAEFLKNSHARKRVIDQLITYLIDNKFQGLNVDFEALLAESHSNYLLFLSELYPKLKEHQLTLSIDLPLNDPAYRYEEFSKLVDYIILMGYDEHWATGTPGPIASYPWFKKSLESRVQELGGEKIIAAIGNYGYDWVKDDTSASGYKGQYTTFSQALQTADLHKATVEFDKESLSPHYQYEKESKTHQAWYQDAVTAFNQIQASRTLGIKNFALWVPGQEDQGFWNLSQGLTGLEILHASDYDLEVQPQPGKRTLTSTSEPILITNQTIDTFPGYFPKAEIEVGHK